MRAARRWSCWQRGSASEAPRNRVPSAGTPALSSCAASAQELVTARYAREGCARESVSLEPVAKKEIGYDWGSNHDVELFKASGCGTPLYRVVYDVAPQAEQAGAIVPVREYQVVLTSRVDAP